MIVTCEVSASVYVSFPLITVVVSTVGIPSIENVATPCGT
jgi:hypothetical protein